MKCYLSCLVLSLKFLENPLLCSHDDFIAYRFMLASNMLISLQVCLVCKSFSKSCPRDQCVLNYGLTTKLYRAKISGGDSKSEKPFSTGQIWLSPDKSGLGPTGLVWSLHYTSLVPWVFIPLDRFLACIWTPSSTLLLPPVI
jgi:hypothetical protein